MKEIEAQKVFRNLLKAQFNLYNLETEILVGNEFKNINSKKWGLKPDLVIFHKIKFITPAKKQVLKSPIGVEFKNTDKFDDITNGVVTQLQKTYDNETYKHDNTKEEFNLSSLAFATTKSIKEGIFYDRNFAEAATFFIERFCWKGKVALILKENNNGLVFSYKNWRYHLNGKRYWKDTRAVM